MDKTITDNLARRCRAVGYSADLDGRYVWSNVLNMAAERLELLQAELDRLRPTKPRTEMAEPLSGHDDY